MPQHRYRKIPRDSLRENLDGERERTGRQIGAGAREDSSGNGASLAASPAALRLRHEQLLDLPSTCLIGPPGIGLE